MRACVLRLALVVIAPLGVLTSCARPEMRVCLDVSADGGCVDRRTELAVGRTYTLVVRGATIPDGSTLVLERFVDGRARLIGRAPLTPAAGHAYATNPVTLPTTGTYRLIVRDEDGDVVARTNVRAPRPSVWNARDASAASGATP